MDKIILMNLLFRSFKYISIIFFSILLNSCNTSKGFTSFENSQNKIINSNTFDSININNLILKLTEADKKLTPQLKYTNNGGSYYKYKKKPGEDDLSINEIRKRIILGNNFYEKDRQNIKVLLNKINDLKINNKLSFIDSGALGLWIPNRNLLVIDFKVIKMGSPTFLDVLRHESIHVAQSCFNNSKNNFPKRIGLPLEFSKEINLNLSHNIYSQNSKDVMYIEREAYSYSKIDGAAIKLLSRYCK